MRILLLADLHVGSIKDVNYYYDVITEIIDKEINFTHCDAVILLGHSIVTGGGLKDNKWIQSK